MVRVRTFREDQKLGTFSDDVEKYRRKVRTTHSAPVRERLTNRKTRRNAGTTSCSLATTTSGTRHWNRQLNLNLPTVVLRFLFPETYTENPCSRPHPVPPELPYFPDSTLYSRICEVWNDVRLQSRISPLRNDSKLWALDPFLYPLTIYLRYLP